MQIYLRTYMHIYAYTYIYIYLYSSEAQPKKGTVT